MAFFFASSGASGTGYSDPPGTASSFGYDLQPGCRVLLGAVYMSSMFDRGTVALIR